MGSSASRIRGWLTRARAIATRCCSPPESSVGRWSFRASRPTVRRSSSARSQPLLLGDPGEQEREGHVLDRRVGVDQVEGLKDHADRVAAVEGELLLAQIGDQPAVDADTARGGPVQAAQQVHERGFARAGGPGHADEPSAGDGQRHTAQGGHLHRPERVHLGQVLCLDESVNVHVGAGTPASPSGHPY